MEIVNYSLSVSIVIHRTPPGQLLTALECIMRSKVDRIYIIDNSPDDSLKEVVPASAVITYIHVANRGFGAGHNIALRNALERGEDPKDTEHRYHLVMNADVWWEGDILPLLVHYMERDINIGVIAPKALNTDGSLQYSCRRLPSPRDLFFKRFLTGNLKEKLVQDYLMKGYDHERPIESPYLTGCFLLFRIQALREVGLFDERFFMYPEDIDICRRMHKRRKVIYMPYVNIIHEHQAASVKNFRMFCIHFWNMVKYFNKWGWFSATATSSFRKFPFVDRERGEINALANSVEDMSFPVGKRVTPNTSDWGPDQ